MLHSQVCSHEEEVVVAILLLERSDNTTKYPLVPIVSWGHVLIKNKLIFLLHSQVSLWWFHEESSISTDASSQWVEIVGTGPYSWSGHGRGRVVIRHIDSPQMYLWHQIWRVVHGPEPRFHLRPSRLEMILLAGTRFTYSTAIIIVVIIIDIEIIVIIDTHILILFRLE